MIIQVETPKIILPQYPRTKGVHLSNIIKCIAAETGILAAYNILEDLSLVDTTSEITDPVALLRISIGLAWEGWYIPHILTHVADHPGEMHCDGIYMNPDGESVSVVTTHIQRIRKALRQVVVEVKATYKSTKTVGLTQEEFIKNFKKNWMWIAQVMAYCRAKTTRFAELHVLFLCSNYKFPIVPALKIFHLEFTEVELQDNWNLLLDYRDERLRTA